MRCIDKRRSAASARILIAAAFRTALAAGPARADTTVGSIESATAVNVPQAFEFLPLSDSQSPTGVVTALQAIDDAYATEIAVPAGVSRLTSAKIRIQKKAGRSVAISIVRGIANNTNDGDTAAATSPEIIALTNIQQVYEITPNITVTPGEKLYVVAAFESVPNLPVACAASACSNPARRDPSVPDADR